MVPVSPAANDLEEMPEDSGQRALVGGLGVVNGGDNAPEIEGAADSDHDRGGSRGGSVYIEEVVREPNEE